MLKTSIKKQLTDIPLRKMDHRRDSTTSDSSVEPMDLGRAADMKREPNSTAVQLLMPTLKDAILSHANTKLFSTRHESDADESDDKDRAADHQRRSHSQHHYHHRRRTNTSRDKRIVHLECTDSPHSLRKKFRISSNSNSSSNQSHNNVPETVIDMKQKSTKNNDSATSAKSLLSTTTTTNNNESGFVDASSSHVLNTSGSSATSSGGSSSSSSPKSSSSSSGSRPASNIASVVSSPESGTGERDDMKYVCPICEVVSATPHEFTNHIRCHNYSSGDTENFTCRICCKVLSSASSLDRHVLVHTGERPFNCKYCQLTFTTNGNMHRHMRTHKQHQQHYHRNSNGAKNSGGGAAVANSNGDGGTSSSTTNLSSTDQSGVSSTTLNAMTSKMATVGNGIVAGKNSDTISGAVGVADGAGGGGGGGESYESDGGCSTDSSSGISQSSNNNNNNCNINNKNISNFKRKSTDSYDDDMAMMKRRVKTTINNNNILHVEKNAIDEGDLEEDAKQQQKLFCPVCNRSDFNGMLGLGAHMDSEHSDIPAKCRHCEVVFKTHKQLNVHPCTSKLKITQGFKDLTFVDFSSEKFPLIAKSLCEQSLRTPVSNQKFECSKCYRAFPCASAVDIHEKECSSSGTNLFVDAHDFSIRKQRAYSESSGGADDDDNRREEFFARLYLKNKSTPHSVTSMSSPSLSDVKSSELEKTPVKMSQLEQFQDTKELADIQAILKITSSSSTSNFLRNFDNSDSTVMSSYGCENGEEEAQDAFTSEFRKMKLRGEFPCKLCTAVFPNLRALKGHNRIHLSAAGAGPYRCNMCPYSINDKAALVRHMRTHNGDRPYECAICNYAFTTKANCERHLRNRHGRITRDEVKRAIIYHPSEDSNCDDAMKKLHMFSSPEFDQDDLEQNHPPKDRSTPVSHLKEMLQAESKPMKIQVKSLEKLIDKAAPSFNHSDDIEKTELPREPTHEKLTRPIDLSMDALDLSKKNVKPPKIEEKPPQSPPHPQTVVQPQPDEPVIDMNQLKKNQQLLMAQQRLLNEAMPKMDPAHYFQLTQLYRSLMFQPLHPFFIQNSLLSNQMGDLNKFAPLMNPLFQHNATGDGPSSIPSNNHIPINSALDETSLLLKQSSSRGHSPAPPKTQLLPRNLTPSLPQMSPMSRSHPHLVSNSHTSGMLPSSVSNTGPVKMVIKNGVLMPKQKQRRYRTERPFACEHCSARFTLRSNMERHIKQQHPTYWAQRQRSGHHISRGRGHCSSVLSHMPSPHSSMEPNAHSLAASGMMSNSLSAISDQVKYAILAQQLKARKETDILQQALSQGSSSVLPPNPTAAINNLRKSLSSSSNTNNGSIEDDDPKLVIDEDDVKEDDDLNEEEDEAESDDRKPENLPKLHDLPDPTKNEAAKKVAESILEQAIIAGGTKPNDNDQKDFGLKLSKNMIAQAESVGKFLKEVASSPFKDEASDLASVSRLVDNANSMSFNYFRRSDVVNQMEQSDEEGLVASGSASESNNSGTEDMANSLEPKKKSAYSSAPNRVSCPYCQRMFPWSSSLRRHILTHTGQKPFKCSHCPLLFTTKSNCDRHLLRKHGNVESAVSLYCPIDDVNEPLPVPKSVEEIEMQQQQQLQYQQQQQKKLEQEKNEQEKVQSQPQQEPEKSIATDTSESINSRGSEAIPQIISSSELPFKCHLCDNSFAERIQCLDHIKIHHAQEFALLLSKGAIDNEADPNNQVQSTEDDEKRDESRGKYPDYSNRKVICAFCVRRFWSTEDLRRHMRTHSGERPFQCDVCLRKFTLKHSMLRHMKKHNGGHASNGNANATNSGSDMSDDEQPPSNVNLATSLHSCKIQELFSKASNEWRNNNRLSGEHKENIEEHNNQSDLIGNLLGISDQGILNKLLSSADEAAKFLGVDK